jgi:hypothetical protein
MPRPKGLRVEAPQRAETLALPAPSAKAAPQPAPPQPVPAPPAPRGKAKKPAAAAPAPAAAAKPEKKGRKGLLKWGIAALLASGLAFGLWVWLSQPSLFGSSSPSAQPGQAGAPAGGADPNDPRSRKADRLPSPPS